MTRTPRQDRRFLTRGDQPMPGVGYLLDEERALELAHRASREIAAPELRISRAVLFLTPHCNMSCDYCLSTGHHMPRWTPEQIKKFVGRLADSGTRHIQWTGGEAALHPDLPDLVRHATSRRMRCSMSTNATASPERYVELVEAGMSRFYLSLDALDAGRFDEITGSRGRLPCVLRTLSTLVDLRDRGARVHVTINTVLHPRLTRNPMATDAGSLRHLLGWLQCSGADDFKLLPPSGRTLTDLFPRRGSLARFVTLCRWNVPARYRMFHLRLWGLEHGGHGLSDLSPRTCFQCLDDRAFDSIGAYGCVIQLREGGPTIYRHGDPPHEKRRRLARFLASDRTADALCSAHCFDLYRRLNERVAHLTRARTPAEHAHGNPQTLQASQVASREPDTQGVWRQPHP